MVDIVRTGVPCASVGLRDCKWNILTVAHLLALPLGCNGDREIWIVTIFMREQNILWRIDPVVFVRTLIISTFLIRSVHVTSVDIVVFQHAISVSVLIWSPDTTLRLSSDTTLIIITNHFWHIRMTFGFGCSHTAYFVRQTTRTMSSSIHQKWCTFRSGSFGQLSCSVGNTNGGEKDGGFEHFTEMDPCI